MLLCLIFPYIEFSFCFSDIHKVSKICYEKNSCVLESDKLPSIKNITHKLVNGGKRSILDDDIVSRLSFGALDLRIFHENNQYELCLEKKLQGNYN